MSGRRREPERQHFQQAVETAVTSRRRREQTAAARDAKRERKAAERMKPREALDRIAELAGVEVVIEDDWAEVDVSRGGTLLYVHKDWEQSDSDHLKVTFEGGSEAMAWPEDDWPDYLGDVGDELDVKPAEALALLERFLEHAERLGFTS